MGSRHVIRRQVIELKIADKQLGYSLQGRISACIKGPVVARLEALFNRYADAKTHVSIGRVEIDVGSLTVADLERELSLKIVEQLEQKLLAGEREHPITAKLPVEKVAAEERALDALLYYLATGHVPWWINVSDFNPSCLLAELFEQPVRIVRRLVMAAIESPNAVRRLAVMASDAQMRELAVAAQSAVGAARFATAVSTLSLLGEVAVKKALSADQLRLAVWEAAICALADAQSNELEAAMLERFIAIAGRDLALAGAHSSKTRLMRNIHEVLEQPLNVSAIAQEMPGGGSHSIIRAAHAKAALQAISPPESTRESFRKAAAKLIASSDAYDETDHAASKEEPTPLKKRAVANTSMLADDVNGQQDEIYLHYAGMVMVWPLLKPLFRDAGLLEGNTFKGNAQHERAVHLAYIMGTGESARGEWQMVMAKVLCGWPILRQLNMEHKARKEETDAIDARLRGLIDAWKVLKKTSPAGLRHGFFEREGILSPAGAGWLLKVERRAQDIMMDQFPWPLSVISLPWMDRMLYVEW